jgi:peptidoglycan/LPS O-acetylase OafA/YrhL
VGHPGAGNAALTLLGDNKCPANSPTLNPLVRVRWESMGRIPTLDGWRGIAILLVIVTHVQAGLLGHVWRYPWMDLGQHGVGIFFVLSGYLITSRLLCDEKGLGPFYIRRFFRLMPCAWLYLAVLPVVGLLLHTRVIGHEVWACLFFYRNYFPLAENAHNAFTSHFWSLSLEEQFYLFWPALLIFAGKRWSFAIAVVGACACGAVRFAMWDQATSHKLATGVRIDALLIGCTLAFLLESEAVRSFVPRHSAMLFMGAYRCFSGVCTVSRRYLRLRSRLPLRR